MKVWKFVYLENKVPEKRKVMLCQSITQQCFLRFQFLKVTFTFKWLPLYHNSSGQNNQKLPKISAQEKTCAVVVDDMLAHD